MNRLLFSVCVSGALLACDPETKYVDQPLTLDLTGCLAPEVDGVSGGTCRDEISSRVDPDDENGCLILSVESGEREVSHHLGFRWRDGWYEMADDLAVAIAPGQTVVAEMYLFAQGASMISCDVDSLSFGTACDESAPWCLMKAVQSQVAVGDAGLVIDFGGASGCDLLGPLSEGQDAEACDGVDNDCDGQVDEGLPLEPEPCESDAFGACRAGLTACVDGDEVCVSQAGPEDELCDGLDNDCDGELDESFGLGTVCEVGLGTCVRAGVLVCGADQQAVCDATAGAPVEEICDGLDQDCDGAADENDPGGGVACQANALGECQSGLTRCVDGGITCESQVSPTQERCDGLDNDCDGAVDNEFEVGEPCFVGAGECRRDGQFRCEQGGQVCDVTAGEPAAERCDGLDNDCDERVDEGQGLGDPCVVGMGACEATGVVICGPDGAPTCSVLPGDPIEERCDGLDNDCDGVADEAFPSLGQPCVEGVGICQRSGVIQCQADGSASCSVSAGDSAPAELCGNGLDDDCDGVQDEGFDLGQACVVGENGCAQTGIFICDGLAANRCSVVARPAAAELCDGVDNDCDAAVDEDIDSVDTTCGVGACGNVGVLRCRDGAFENTCLPTLPSSDDTTCDGVDDDCDGDVDEGYQSVEVSCGVGACAAVAMTRCEDGALVDDCAPGVPALEDTTCDDVDEDCDGRLGEDFAPSIVQCGVGECLRDGVRFCRAGVLSETCEPGDPELELCDSQRDEDCDGAVDEVSVNLGQACSTGVGECERAGVFVCAPDRLGTECDAVAGAPVEDICDQLDNDCDGVADEDFDLRDDVLNCGACENVCEFDSAVPICADGVCSLSGCDDGFVDLDQDASNGCEYACTPTNENVEACDQSDNDCDGAIDETFDLDNDLAHCGGCGLACDPPNAQPVCLNGGCAIQGCDDGFVDLDQASANGCEYACSLTNGGVESCDGQDNDCDGLTDEEFNFEADIAHCGACDAVCAAPNGTPSCQQGGCVIEACDDGFVDLDGAADNGCEYQCEVTNEGVEACDGADNDCDGGLDEGFDLSSELANCGACGQLCAPVNSSPVCVDGQCRVQACDVGFVNLDGLDENGCEYQCSPTNGGLEACDGADNDCDGSTDEDFDLSADPAHCGGCGQVCDVLNGTPACVEGVCAIGSCAVGFADCDGDADTGCESSLGDLANCGQCGAQCDLANALESCGAGQCILDACEQGFYDLDGDAANGCEYACDETNAGVEACDGVDNDCDGVADETFDLSADVSHCGACNQACNTPNGTPVCVDGACAVDICAADFADCDLAPDNGCESALNSLAHCGACDQACSLDNASEVCEQGQCLVDSCSAGFFNIDGLDINGCEYACVESNGGVEACDGVDNDCSGVADDGAEMCGDLEVCLQGSCEADQDEDQTADSVDNCVGVANADQADRDQDDVGDACEVVDFCEVVYTGAPQGQANPPEPIEIYGRIREAGITDRSLEVDDDPLVIVEAGFGPGIGQLPDPLCCGVDDPEWTWVSAVASPSAQDAAAPDLDYYVGAVISFPAPNVYGFAIRVSVDGGSQFTYCDRNTTVEEFDPTDLFFIDIQ